MLKPKRLRPGDRIAVVAPASAFQREEFDKGIAELERLQILVDGAQGKYMLQIFLREAAALHDDVRAGPFFYEVIQRCGDEGFGYGNFRALFESIERFQKGHRG